MGKNMSISVDFDLSPAGVFRALFKELHDSGRGRDRGIQSKLRRAGWKKNKFLDTLSKAGYRSSSMRLSHWLNGNNAPNSIAETAIARVFFPNATIDEADKREQKEFNAIWNSARRYRYGTVAPRKLLGQLELEPELLASQEQVEAESKQAPQGYVFGGDGDGPVTLVRHFGEQLLNTPDQRQDYNDIRGKAELLIIILW